MAASDTFGGYADNYGDLTNIYSGLSDTAVGYTGSSTLQDVTLGSPLVLDTSYTPDNYVLQSSATPDFITMLGSDPLTAAASQTLSGVSDTPVSETAASYSSPTPNVQPTGEITASALTALGKLGAGFASLFGGQSRTVTPAVNYGYNPATQASLTGSSALPISGSSTLLLVVVVGALALLLMRGE